MELPFIKFTIQRKKRKKNVMKNQLSTQRYQVAKSSKMQFKVCLSPFFLPLTYDEQIQRLQKICDEKSVRFQDYDNELNTLKAKE